MDDGASADVQSSAEDIGGGKQAREGGYGSDQLHRKKQQGPASASEAVDDKVPRHHTQVDLYTREAQRHHFTRAGASNCL